MAGRLRALSRVARALRRAAVDGVAGADPRTGIPRPWSSARVELDEDVRYRKYLQWIAGEQWATARSRARGVALLRRSSVRRERRQRGRLDATGRVQAGRVGRRAARCVQRDGTELGTSRLPVGRAGRAGLSVAAATRAGATPTCSTAIASITSSASTGCMSDRSAAARGSSRRPCRTSRWRSASACSASSARPAPRSLPRTSASCRTSCASRWRGSAFPATGCFDGSATGRSRASRFATRRSIRPASVATSGTHDTEPLAIWWEHAPTEERHAVLAIPSIRDRLMPTTIVPRAVSEPQLPLDGPRRAARSAVRVGFGPADSSRPGRVRVARSHQSTGDGRRSELDLEAALAERPPGDRARGHATWPRSCAPGPRATAARNLPVF